MFYQTCQNTKVDVVIFIEHRDRELAIATEIAFQLETLGRNVAVCSSIYHLMWAIIKLTPKVVVTPSTSFGKGSAAYLYYSVFGASIGFINLNYEQFVSSWKGSYKTSSHEFSKTQQIQLVWGQSFKDELIKNGINKKNILITGRPSLELLENQYAGIGQAELISKYPDFSNKKLCFVGLTDGLAFVTDKKVESVVAAGADKNGLLQHIEYIKENMGALFQEITEEANKRDDLIFILRPHPSVPVSAYVGLFEKLNFKVPKNVLITKDMDAFWWLAVSDYYVTNYSTLCLESKILGLPSFIYESFKSKNVESYWYTKTAIKCSKLSTVFSHDTNCIPEPAGSNYYIDFSKKGLSETVKVINDLVELSYPVKSSAVLKVLLVNFRKVLGNIVRNIYVKLGIRPFDKVSRGLVEDYFEGKDVKILIERKKNEI